MAVSIKRFNHALDKKIIGRWLESRGMNPAIVRELPEIGYLALNGSEYVAAGFLRKAEGNYGIADGFVTNPEINGTLRNEGLDEVLKQIISKAKQLRLKVIIAWTKDFNTLSRAKRHGFEEIPNAAMALDLSK